MPTQLVFLWIHYWVDAAGLVGDSKTEAKSTQILKQRQLPVLLTFYIPPQSKFASGRQHFSIDSFALIHSTMAPNVQVLPWGTAVAVGGPAVALGGLSLLFLKAYADDQRRKSSSNLPLVPGNFYMVTLSWYFYDSAELPIPYSFGHSLLVKGSPVLVLAIRMVIPFLQPAIPPSLVCSSPLKVLIKALRVLNSSDICRLKPNPGESLIYNVLLLLA